MAFIHYELLHNGNIKSFIPIDHALNSEETYEIMSILIKLIKYKQYCGKHVVIQK